MGTIIPFIPLAKAFKKYLPKVAERPFSPIEAAFSLMIDYDDQNEVTVAGYAKLWKWNKKTVSKFITDHGAKIVYPKDTKVFKNQRGLISILKRDLKGTNKGLIVFIDNKDLQTNRVLKGTKEGLKRDLSVPSTIEPKPKPKKYIYSNEFEEVWKITPKRNGVKQGKKPASILFEKLTIEDKRKVYKGLQNYSKFLKLPSTTQDAMDLERFIKNGFFDDYQEEVKGEDKNNNDGSESAKQRMLDTQKEIYGS